MLDIKEQKMGQEESGFTEVSGLEVRVHLGEVDGRGASLVCFPCCLF